MNTTTLLLTALLAMLPISELRGAIPFAVIRGVSILPAALISVALNALVPLLAFLFFRPSINFSIDSAGYALF